MGESTCYNVSIMQGGIEREGQPGKDKKRLMSKVFDVFRKKKPVEAAQPPPTFEEKVKFMQKFDGSQPEVPTQEKKHVAKIFNSFIDDKFLNNSEEVITFGIDDELEFTLTLGNRNSIRMSLSQYGGITSKDKYILIQHMLAGHGRETFDYRIEDGAVIRHNKGDEYENLKRDKLYKDSSKEIPGKNTSIIRDIPNDYQNYVLEKKMGVNNCPIGLDEMLGLRDLIMSGELVKK